MTDANPLAANEIEGIRDQLAASAIRNALLDYCRGVDRRAYELVRSAYHPDAYDDHGPYKGDVDGLLVWIEERHAFVDQSMHFLGNCRIERQGSSAAVETYALVLQRFGEQGNDSVKMYSGGGRRPEDPSRIMTACRYVDRFEERDGAWKIARRATVIETIWHPPAPEDIPADATWTLATRDDADILWEIRGEVVDGRPDVIAPKSSAV